MMRSIKIRKFLVVSVLILVIIVGCVYIAFDVIMDRAMNMMLDGAVGQLDQKLNQELDQSLKIVNEPKASIVPIKSQVKTDKKNNDDTTVMDTNDKKSSTPKGDITLDQAINVKSNFSMADKITVASVLISKFSANELGLFEKMVSGGITTEEKKEAKIIFLQKLSEEEYNELISIAAKYGLSQGRKFNETQTDYVVPKP